MYAQSFILLLIINVYAQRWFPVAQLGVPHKAMADDYYDGMFIPKGATVIANSRYVPLSAALPVSTHFCAQKHHMG